MSQTPAEVDVMRRAFAIEIVLNLSLPRVIEKSMLSMSWVGESCERVGLEKVVREWGWRKL